ncbi:MAG: MFS transporter, partial [Clostridiales bacterium]|nr:MFS transporter [Clostridiales bacterium]
LQFIYYTAMAMLFWLAYTIYTIPYYAVVAEITEDYDERTSIRSTSSLINTVAIFLGNALPSFLPTVLGALVISGFKMGESRGWTLTALIMSIMAIAFALITVKSLKGLHLTKAEAAKNPADRKGLVTIVKEYIEVLTIKPFKWLSMFIVFFLIASAMIQSSFEYMVKDAAGADPEIWMTVIIVELVTVMAIFIPIVTKIAEAKDRRVSSLIFMSTMCAGLVVCKIIGVTSIPVVLAVTFFMAVGMANFWTVFYSLAYDLVEVDELATGNRREGVITGLPQFFQKFGSAVGVWLVGFFLQISGYDAHLQTQSPAVKDGIENNVTLFPAIFLTLSILGMVFYPVTRSKFALLQEKLEKKRAGEEYTTEGLEKII